MQSKKPIKSDPISANPIANFLAGLQIPEADLKDPQLDLAHTADRVTTMWCDELLASYKPGAEAELRKRMWTATRSMNSDASMIVVHSMPFTSVCAHHLLPFVGTAAIGYVPDKVILGLSKFGRVVEHFARMLQIQERLGEQTADFLVEILKPTALLVRVESDHMCVSMRGIAKPGTVVASTALRGKAWEPEVRAEFYRLMPQVVR